MKFNLKNRPLTDYVINYEGKRKLCQFATIEEVHKWFEGFEKELRDHLKAYQGFEDRGNQNYGGKIELTKMILGET